ncbi:MAG: hypothetical protein J5476_10125 [Lachnospiraceae bacterium]|nr:hypothetical protein [Lachnospiraceae bacterium]
MEILGYLILGCIGAGILFIAVKFTILIETPIIIHGGITENKKYISAINSITNVIFNVVLVFISFVEWPLGMIVWYAVAEFLLIPVSEILAYKAISKADIKKIIKTTYSANMLSFVAGSLFVFMLMAVLSAF